MTDVQEQPQLSAAQQDYLEAVYALSLADEAGEGVRVTDIAARLSTKLPTVVRTLARLRAMGLVTQKERGPVFLTKLGLGLSAQLAHRHEDVMYFLTEVLGVAQATAETEACVMEHGLSGESSERLHHFLEAWQKLDPKLRSGLREAAGHSAETEFDLVGDASGSGDRA
jgi:DtxR family Mn-dependent transcriptional regulator